jgi:hypothetical protein
MKVHESILPATQRRLWTTLGRTSRLGFVLYGGTAIALRFGHRESVDFDFFSERALDKQAVRSVSPLLENGVVLQDQPETLTLAVPISGADVPVKVSFFGGITFGRVGEPDMAESGVLIASPADLLATKLKVMLERVEAKDYRDVATLVRSGVELSSGLAAAALLFKPAFQPSESLKALVYFKGGDLDTLSSAERRVLTEAAGAVRDLPVIALRSGSLAAQHSESATAAAEHAGGGPPADRGEGH